MKRSQFARATSLALLVTSLGGSALVYAAPAGDGEGSLSLRHRSYRDWDILLPNEEFAKVGSAFPAFLEGGKSFRCELEGTALAIDRDGDGSLDLRIPAADAQEGKFATVTLTDRLADGSPMNYTVRLRNDGGWAFASAGAMVGKLDGTRVQIIDQNNNGRYDDFGVDAMIVGRSKSASFLSETVSVGDALYRIRMAPDGRRMSFSAYQGESGVLDVYSGFQTEAKLTSVIVRDETGRHSFDLAKAREGLRVPAGRYLLHSGLIALGEGEVFLRAGRARPMQVESDAKTVLSWGGPLKAEFDYLRQGDQLMFNPSTVWYFGQGGEEYYGWMPRGASPAFSVKEKNTGDELVNVKFPGSC